MSVSRSATDLDRSASLAWRGWAAIVAPAVLTLVLAGLTGIGLRGSDDLGYSELAMSALRGDGSVLLHETTHHAARLGMIAPLAVVFTLFGAGDWSLSLLPLVSTVVTTAVVAWLARRTWGAMAGLLAGLVYALIPLTIGLSTFYVPEPLLNLELSLAVVAFVLARETAGSRGVLLRLGAGMLIGVGYLTTEAGALLLVAFLCIQLIERRFVAADLLLGVGFLVILGGELGYHAAVHGTPLYRFTLARDYSADPMVQSANVKLFYRLFKAYPGMLAYPGADFGILGVLLIAAMVYGLVTFRRAGLYVLWAAVILAFYNFMTASFKQYVALPVAPRLIAPACVPLAILAGAMLASAWTWARGRNVPSWAPVLAATPFVVISVYSMAVAVTPPLTRAVARNAAATAGYLSTYPAITFVTDRFTARALQFYRGFNRKDIFVPFEEATRMATPGRPVFVVLNGPVLNEEPLTGHVYRSGLHPGSPALAFTPAPADTVFVSRYPGGIRERLVRTVLGRYLLGEYNARVIRMLGGDAPVLAEVRAFRYNFVVPEGNLRRNVSALP